MVHPKNLILIMKGILILQLWPEVKDHNGKRAEMEMTANTMLNRVNVG
jgi:hypothetical protein